LLCALACLVTASLGAQQRTRLRQETSFHTEAGGIRLGTLNAGTSVPIVRTSGDWREITLEAWIWSASLGPANRDGFNVVVTEGEGENLRVQPNGLVLGRAIAGTHFSRVNRQGGWTRVRRRAWIGVTQVQAVQEVQRVRDTAGAPTSAPRADTAPAPRTRPPSDPREPVVIQRGAELHAGPGAEVLGTVPREMRAEVTERASGWVKVRAELWVRAEDLAPAPLRSQDAVTLRDLQGEPERFLGREVLWRLQYLSVQVADELRPELPSGEPYVLARGPLPEAGFVYLAVTEAQAERFRGMQPLTEFVAQGTILAPKTRYLPTPIIRLVRLP
jgi:hypothetical protein